MTVRQRLLKLLYPLVMLASRMSNKKSMVMKNEKAVQPIVPIYDVAITMNNGQTKTLAEYKGKKLLLVNTASNCGYTDQYKELQQLYDQYKDQVEVIAFPSNDFKEQEKGSDEEIAQFCQVNYGVTFPLAKKSTVIKTGYQNKLFHWLSHKEENGWNEQEPTWNFSKYLISEDGALMRYFDPAISPLSNEVIEAIKL
ncbi:MAG: glutathione peroxidase [Chitinophagaceae bacterium]